MSVRIKNQYIHPELSEFMYSNVFLFIVWLDVYLLNVTISPKFYLQSLSHTSRTSKTACKPAKVFLNSFVKEKMVEAIIQYSLKFLPQSSI